MSGSLLLLLGLVAAAWSGQTASAEVEPPRGERDRLTREELMQPKASVPEPVHNACFAALGPSGVARHELRGTLEVPETNALPVKGRFPSFEVELFTHHGRLIPTKRDIIPGGNSPWDIILSPGRVWSEPGDEGWSRASFPFVLAGRTWNESHNGLATFVYNETEVSPLRVQIVQEAASWSQFDAAASVPLVYAPGPIKDLTERMSAYEEEQARLIPTRPWADLAARADPNLLAAAEGRAEHLTFLGLLIDGVLYAQPCRTRYGDYPYCQEMRHGVFSVTKTMGAALALLWLTQRYGEGVLDLRITDYVDVTAEHDGWSRVTFRHAINMATGIGDRAPTRISTGYDFEADDSGPIFDRFAAARSALEKLDVAFSAGKYPWGPGEVGRYNSTHTFVLSAAMDAFLKSKEGPAAHLWDRVMQEVLEPIGVLHAPMMHTRERDGGRGIPLMGWGYFPTADEMMKIAELLQKRGRYRDRQLLGAAELAEVLSATGDPGYDIAWTNPFGRYHYHLSFWRMPFRACDRPIGIPEMMGYGGNLVTLLPNRMIAVRLADAPEGSPGMYDGEPIARLAHQLSPFCAGTLPPAGESG